MRRFIAAAVVAIAASIVAQPAEAAPADPCAPGEEFLWGVVTSGYESEGSAPDSNWRRYERAKTSAIKHPYGNAVDFRHRYAEDIANAKKVGVGVFRFGIEWARVEPKEDVYDETELAYYDDVVRQIRHAGMRPMITLSHFVHPGWVVDQGGWTSDKTVTDFADFTRAVVQRYGDQDALWITFNEPHVYVQFEVSNGGINPWEAPGMFARLVTAHRQAFDTIHELDPAPRCPATRPTSRPRRTP